MIGYQDVTRKGTTIMFKKLTTVLTIGGLLICLAGCQTQTLDDAGESLFALMDDMVNSDAYLSSIGLPGITAEKQ